MQEVCASESTRPSCRQDLSRHAAVYGVVLSMVEDIVVLPPEVHTRSLGKRKLLEDTKVEVNAIRQKQGITSDVTKREPRGRPERIRVERQWSALSGVLIRSKT